MKTLKCLFVLTAVLFLYLTSLFAQETFDENVQDPLQVNPIPLESSFEPSNSGSLKTIQPKDSMGKISLDVKGMDIVDILKILSSRSGMNIVIGKNVSGRVTLFLKDVDINDAFDIVILANDLAYDKKGEIVNIMASRDYEIIYGESFADKKKLVNIPLKHAKANNILQVLNQVKSSKGRVIIDEPTNSVIIIDNPDKLSEMEKMAYDLDRPLESKIFNLNYAQAEKLNTKLQESLTKGIGSVKIDERTNKVVVTDYPERVRDIERIIGAFDEKTPQVIIDAQIVEISPNKDEFSMGVDWDYWIKKNVRIINALPAPGLPSAATIGTKLAFGVASGDQQVTPDKPGQYKSIIEALRVIGETKILSSPRIMALNNQEARILVGTKEAYITSTTSQAGTGSTITSQSVNFVDVGIKLYVTPIINKEGFVTVKVRPEISSSESKEITAEDKKTEIPIVTTSETETTIMIKDGTTIMIAGLKKDKRQKEVKKIPILGDIPGLGYLFRNMKDTVTKTELVVFITPHIISGDEPIEYTSLTRDKDIAYIQSKAQADKTQGRLNKENDFLLEYKTNIYNKIKEEVLKAKKNNKLLSGNIKMSFILNSQGQVIDEPKVLSSSNDLLNQAAAKCIKTASPFLPLPGSLGKDIETFKINLSYD